MSVNVYLYFLTLKPAYPILFFFSSTHGYRRVLTNSQSMHTLHELYKNQYKITYKNFYLVLKKLIVDAALYDKCQFFRKNFVISK